MFVKFVERFSQLTPNENNNSDSNLLARSSKLSKTVLDNVLKLKKMKEKKQSANKISSLKTINSMKHKTEKINKNKIKVISSINFKKIYHIK
jgi:hypothetical protein